MPSTVQNSTIDIAVLSSGCCISVQLLKSFYELDISQYIKVEIDCCNYFGHGRKL